MRCRWLLMGAALAGCAGPSAPPEIGYVPPVNSPVGARRAVVEQPPYLVWGNLLDHLQQSEFEVTQTDGQRGIIVATYSGDPEPYVNCGWIVSYGGAPFEPVSASSNSARLPYRTNNRDVALQRSLKLDSRMVVRLQPQNVGTLVTTDTTYVLTKTIEVEDGGASGSASETISFKGNGSGAFSKGTTCQPTGRFELAALDILPTSVATSGAGTSGWVSPDAVVTPESRALQPSDREEPLAPTSAVDEDTEAVLASLDCGGGERPFCEVLKITAPYRIANQEQRLGLEVGTYGNATTLIEGADLVLEISLPRYDSYLHVGYLQRDGQVGFLESPIPEQWPASSERRVADTGYEIAGPYGLEMIVAVATETPLFDDVATQFVDADSYLAELQRRLDALRVDQPEQQITANYVFVNTEPVRAAY